MWREGAIGRNFCLTIRHDRYDFGWLCNKLPMRALVHALRGCLPCGPWRAQPDRFGAAGGRVAGPQGSFSGAARMGKCLRVEKGSRGVRLWHRESPSEMIWDAAVFGVLRVEPLSH